MFLLLVFVLVTLTFVTASKWFSLSGISCLTFEIFIDYKLNHVKWWGTFITICQKNKSQITTRASVGASTCCQKEFVFKMLFKLLSYDFRNKIFFFNNFLLRLFVILLNCFLEHRAKDKFSFFFFSIPLIIFSHISLEKCLILDSRITGLPFLIMWKKLSTLVYILFLN